MKKRKNMRKRRFKAMATRPASPPRLIEVEPEDFVPSLRRAEQVVLPRIKEMNLGPGAAVFLLAQQAQALFTGDQRVSVDSAMAITTNVLALWQAGYYTPRPEYPYTLEETLRDVRGGPETREGLTDCFQPFTPVRGELPRGFGQIAGGLVRHPETHLWQIWIMIDGSYAFFGAYRDAAKAQHNLGAIITAIRRGETAAKRNALFTQAEAQGDGTARQLPSAMMAYLFKHLDRYQIRL